MEAKDTVMDEKQQEHIEDNWWRETKAVNHRQALCEAQAEISFRAGQEEESTQAYHVGLADGVLRGRKEVVEWVDEHYYMDDLIAVDKKYSWKAQKKEWDVEKDLRVVGLRNKNHEICQFCHASRTALRDMLKEGGRGNLTIVEIITGNCPACKEALEVK